MRFSKVTVALIAVGVLGAAVVLLSPRRGLRPLPRFPAIGARWDARRDACSVDDDCALTLVADGECCLQPCRDPDVHSRRFVEALERQVASGCHDDNACPDVMCTVEWDTRDLRPAPQCLAGKCSTKLVHRTSSDASTPMALATVAAPCARCPVGDPLCTCNCGALGAPCCIGDPCSTALTCVDGSCKSTDAAALLVPSDLMITYGFGACQAAHGRVDIQINALGAGAYDSHGRGPKSHVAFQLTQDGLGHLLADVERAGFFEMPDRAVNEHVMDGSCNAISVRRNGVTKTVLDQNTGGLEEVGNLISRQVPTRSNPKSESPGY